MKNLSKICTLFAFVAVFSLFFGIYNAKAFYDGFDSYEIGDINGQGGWASYSGDNVISATQDFSSPYSLSLGTHANWAYSPTLPATTSADWTFNFFMGTTTKENDIDFFLDGTGTSIRTYIRCSNSSCSIFADTVETTLTGISQNNWHNLIIRIDAVNKNVSYSLDYGDFTSTYNWLVSTGNTFQNITISGFCYTGSYCASSVGRYVDNISNNTFSEPHIDISSPASGSTITASSDTMVVNYYDLDREIYNGFLMNFRDDKLHSSTNSYDFKMATSDAGTGSFSIPLSTFGFDTNGHWDLHASAYGYSLEIQDGLFLTTRGYIDTLSGELVDPPYHLIFNIAGFSEPFVFDDWDTWYGTNVSDYASPTTFATTITGYLQPYFEKVGGFGAQASLYFNEAEAYDRGYGLGEIIPIILQYNSKIDMFFGGFPIFTFFRYLLYTMIAMFIVRTILKFIPFIG
jgi:hypothetical protein